MTTENTNRPFTKNMWDAYVPPESADAAVKSQAAPQFESLVFVEGTRLKATLKSLTWEERKGDRYLNARWQVLEPAAVKNHSIWSKMRVYGNNSQSKRAMDHLWVLGVFKKSPVVETAFSERRELTDVELGELVGTTAVLNLSLWLTKPNDGEFASDSYRSGNWIRALLTETTSVTETPITVNEKGERQAKGLDVRRAAPPAPTDTFSQSAPDVDLDDLLF